MTGWESLTSLSHQQLPYNWQKGRKDRVRTGPGNPGKSLNFKKSFSRPGKSLNFDAGPGKSWKFGLDYIFYWKICSEVFNLIEHGLIYWCKALVFLTKCSGYFPWCRRPKHVRIVFFSYENQLPIHDFWSWKIEKKSWKGPGKVLEFVWADCVRTLIIIFISFIKWTWA